MEENKLFDLDICDIKRYLPNRYPFLLVDRVAEVIPGHSARGYKNVTVNEGYFQGHFPNSPLMPGMIQMEALLQLLSLTVLSIEGNAGKIVKGVAANKIRLKERVVPGSRLDMEASLTDWNGKKGKGIVRGFMDGKETCGAEFEFEMIHDREE